MALAVARVEVRIRTALQQGREMAQRLRGQVALVTGASRGAGCGIALALGEEGATVYVTGRSVRGRTCPRSSPLRTSG